MPPPTTTTSKASELSALRAASRPITPRECRSGALDERALCGLGGRAGVLTEQLLHPARGARRVGATVVVEHGPDVARQLGERAHAAGQLLQLVVGVLIAEAL